MSIHFDPSNSTNGAQPSPERKNPSLLDRWVDCMYEGALKESLSPENYCKRAWIQQMKSMSSSHAQPPEEFMKRCITDCLDFKQFCNWSRIN